MSYFARHSWVIERRWSEGQVRAQAWLGSWHNIYMNIFNRRFIIVLMPTNDVKYDFFRFRISETRTDQVPKTSTDYRKAGHNHTTKPTSDMDQAGSCPASDTRTHLCQACAGAATHTPTFLREGTGGNTTPTTFDAHQTGSSPRAKATGNEGEFLSF